MRTAIELADLDELLRVIDACCVAREWDLLAELRERCIRALDTGRQLWPAASHAEYRLALEAPAPHAAAVLVEGAGRFAPGPLPEVTASTHTWAELVPHLAPHPPAGLVAHERVLRGDTIDPRAVPHADVLGVPLALAPWEPEYPVARYRADHVDAPAPDLPHGRSLVLPASSPPPASDPDVRDALRALVRAWTADSEGRARVVAVRGDAAAAVAALGATNVRGAWLDGAEALALLGWAGASGGRHGRRRGAAVGRDLAWAVAAACAGLGTHDDLDPDELGAAIGELRWLAWQAPDAGTGWVLRLAVEDPVAGVAFAIDAVDA
jgi:hypothetical protein